jgi:hypothetical protein
MAELDAKGARHRLPTEMPGAADAGAAEGECAGRRARRRGNRRKVPPGLARRAPEDIGRRAEGADRRETLGQGVGEAGVDRRVQHDRVGREEQRQPVRRGTRDDLGGDRGRRARPVLHHHRLAPGGLQAVRRDAADEVGRPAGREADQQPDRAVGPGGLCAGGGGGDQGGQRKQRAARRGGGRHGAVLPACPGGGAPAAIPGTVACGSVMGEGGWCRVRDSNPRPSVYKTAALPLC